MNTHEVRVVYDGDRPLCRARVRRLRSEVDPCQAGPELLNVDCVQTAVPALSQLR
jgi:hypothetical protein